MGALEKLSGRGGGGAGTTPTNYDGFISETCLSFSDESNEEEIEEGKAICLDPAVLERSVKRSCKRKQLLLASMY